MNESSFIAEVILQGVRDLVEISHERMLISHYGRDEARQIVENLLSSTSPASVDIARDDGSVERVDMPSRALRRGDGTTVEMVPFVVDDDADIGSEMWTGSRGFASRLRDNFARGGLPGCIRVLLLFDADPVETERTTMSAELSVMIDGTLAAMSWVASGEAPFAFGSIVFDRVVSVLRLWNESVENGTLRPPVSHWATLIGIPRFLRHCELVADPGDVGCHLPDLGLLFSDRGLFEDPDRVAERLRQNMAVADGLERIRQQRLQDPVRLAEEIVLLGERGEPFYDSIVAALYSADDAITGTGIEYSDVAQRLRTNERLPVRLDVRNAVLRDVSQSGESLPVEWELLTPVQSVVSETDASEPDLWEVAAASPSGSVQILFPLLPTEDTVLVIDGTERRSLRGGRTETVALSLLPDEYFKVSRLEVRRNQRSRRAIQTVLVALSRGSHLIVPNAGDLETAHGGCYVIDGSMPDTVVRVGPHEESFETPGADPVSLSLADSAVRWRGVDRQSTRPDASTRSVPTTLPDGFAASTVGVPTEWRPYVDDLGRLCVLAGGLGAVLNVSREYLEAEDTLLRDPLEILGPDRDSRTARDTIERFAPPEASRWFEARRDFFHECVETCRAVLGQDSPATMYLLNLRAQDLQTKAWTYVSAYKDLLSATVSGAASAPIPAAIEPLLFCDRGPEVGTTASVTIAPCHPLAVALLATLQCGPLAVPCIDAEERESIAALLHQPLISQVIPWVPWRNVTVYSTVAAPLLWRWYGAVDNTAVEIDADLETVVEAHVSRFLKLAPYLDNDTQTIYLNADLHRGEWRYLARSLARLVDKYRCAFDVGIVSDNPAHRADELVRSLALSDELRAGEVATGRMRLRGLSSLDEREAHLAFRPTAPNASTHDFTWTSANQPEVMDTATLAGLNEEPLRFARHSVGEVSYFQYVATSPGASLPTTATEGVWGGPWHSLLRGVKRLSQQLAVGLIAPVQPDAVPTRVARQMSDPLAEHAYHKSFLTIHTDPTQGPDFFTRASLGRSQLYLVESADRPLPGLPGRNVVSVTPRIRPFRAALRKALQALPDDLSSAVDDTVAEGLLRDINVLRGSWVFDFIQQGVREDADHRMYLAGLDNVLAMRLLLSRHARPTSEWLPLPLSLGDRSRQAGLLKAPSAGERCDDVALIWLPHSGASSPRLCLQVVEVKYGNRAQAWRKAALQVSATASQVRARLPSGSWQDQQAVRLLFLERELSWLIEETIERLHAFGLTDRHVEESWGIRDTLSRLHSGDFELEVGAFSEGTWTRELNGTAVMLDPELPGSNILYEEANKVQYITVPVQMLAYLLTQHAPKLTRYTNVVDTTTVVTPKREVSDTAHAGSDEIDTSPPVLEDRPGNGAPADDDGLGTPSTSPDSDGPARCSQCLMGSSETEGRWINSTDSCGMRQ